MSDLLTTDVVQQFFYGALKDMPVPVSQPPGDSEAETWITFNEVSADSRTASNGVQRVRHLVQLHGWSHSQDDDPRGLLHGD